MFIQRTEPRLMVHIAGKARPKGISQRKPEPALARTFRHKGLRVIFVLLSVPNAVAETYRTLASWSGVSLGTVSHTLRDLERLGFLRRGRTRELTNHDELFSKWIEGFAAELRPKLALGHFHSAVPNWPLNLTRETQEASGLSVGGDHAAALMTGVLRPGSSITLYADPDSTAWARSGRLDRDPHGEIEVLRALLEHRGYRQSHPEET